MAATTWALITTEAAATDEAVANRGTKIRASKTTDPRWVTSPQILATILLVIKDLMARITSKLLAINSCKTTKICQTLGVREVVCIREVVAAEATTKMVVAK